MPLPNELVQLVERLAAKTKTHDVTWSEPSRTGRFVAEIGDTSIQIFRWERPYLDDEERERSQSVVAVQLFDSGGLEIISADVSENEIGFYAVNELYQAALIQTRDVKGTVDRLLFYLKDPKPRLEIKKAVYGALSSGRTVDCTATLAAAVKNDHLSIKASNDVFSDPAKGLRKQLHVTFALDGDEKSKTVNENDLLVLP